MRDGDREGGKRKGEREGGRERRGGRKGGSETQKVVNGCVDITTRNQEAHHVPAMRRSVLPPVAAQTHFWADQ